MQQNNQSQNQQSPPGSQAPPSEPQKPSSVSSAPANGQPATKTPTPGKLTRYTQIVNIVNTNKQYQYVCHQQT